LSSSILDIVSIAQVVQAAVAPVFLLTGVAALLGILSTRLGRVTDRAREIETRMANGLVGSEYEAFGNKELRLLWQRARMLNNSFILCTFCALMVCLVVMMIFLSYVLGRSMSDAISMLFIAAMVVLILALLMLLREVFISTATMREGLEQHNINLTKR
jgi:hypothetical protein